MVVNAVFENQHSYTTAHIDRSITHKKMHNQIVHRAGSWKEPQKSEVTRVSLKKKQSDTASQTEFWNLYIKEGLN